MKFLIPLSLVWALCGCGTNSLESRKHERPGAYSGLSTEARALVDQGQILVGMPMDAVYIAWGKPEQILETQSPAGTVVTWLYHGTHLKKHRYWKGEYSAHGPHNYYQPRLAHEYEPMGYVSAEVHFQDGLVTTWRTLPRPPE